MTDEDMKMIMQAFDESGNELRQEIAQSMLLNTANISRTDPTDCI